MQRELRLAGLARRSLTAPCPALQHCSHPCPFGLLCAPLRTGLAAHTLPLALRHGGWLAAGTNRTVTSAAGGRSTSCLCRGSGSARGTGRP